MGKISFSVIVIGTMSVLLAGFHSQSQKNPVQKNPENPKTILFPAYSTSSTSLESPGSNLTDVPAGIFRWNP